MISSTRRSSPPNVSFADELSTFEITRSAAAVEDRPNSVVTDSPSNACSYSEVISK